MTPCGGTYDPTPEGTPITYKENLRECFLLNEELVKRNLERTAQTMKTRYDKRHVDKTFQVGDVVKLRIKAHKKGCSHKLEPKWEGKYTISERIGELNYRIQDEAGKYKAQHQVDKLKLYHEFTPQLADPGTEQLMRTPARSTAPTNGRHTVKPTDGRLRVN